MYNFHLFCLDIYTITEKKKMEKKKLLEIEMTKQLFAQVLVIDYDQSLYVKIRS